MGNMGNIHRVVTSAIIMLVNSYNKILTALSSSVNPHIHFHTSVLFHLLRIALCAETQEGSDQSLQLDILHP